MKFHLEDFHLAHIEEDADDRSVQLRLSIYEEEYKKRRDGYCLKFDSMKDCNIFLNKIYIMSSPSLSSSTNRLFDDTTSSLEKTPTKVTMNTTAAHQSQSYITEFNKLIIYCQGVKLKEHYINKAQDLLGNIAKKPIVISENGNSMGRICFVFRQNSIV